MPRRSRVINLGLSTTEDDESLIGLPRKKKAAIGGDPRSLKINTAGSVEIRPYGPRLFATNCAEQLIPFTYLSDNIIRLK